MLWYRMKPVFMKLMLYAMGMPIHICDVRTSPARGTFLRVRTVFKNPSSSKGTFAFSSSFTQTTTTMDYGAWYPRTLVKPALVITTAFTLSALDIGPLWFIGILHLVGYCWYEHAWEATLAIVAALPPVVKRRRQVTPADQQQQPSAPPTRRNRHPDTETGGSQRASSHTTAREH